MHEIQNRNRTTVEGRYLLRDRLDGFVVHHVLRPAFKLHVEQGRLPDLLALRSDPSDANAVEVGRASRSALR